METQPLTEMSNKTTFWSGGRGRGGRCLGLRVFRHLYANCLEILETSASWKPKGLSKPAQRLLFIANQDLFQTQISSFRKNIVCLIFHISIFFYTPPFFLLYNNDGFGLKLSSCYVLRPSQISCFKSCYSLGRTQFSVLFA